MTQALKNSILWCFAILLTILFMLTGCKDKPVFTIEKTATIQDYENNPIFKALPVIETGYNSEYYLIRYEFEDMPQSVYNIPLNDLKFTSGMIDLEYLKTADPNKMTPNFSLYFKGSDDFRTLADRITASGLVDNCDGYFQFLFGIEWLRWSRQVGEEEIICMDLKYIHNEDTIIVNSLKGMN